MSFYTLYFFLKEKKDVAFFFLSAMIHLYNLLYFNLEGKEGLKKTVVETSGHTYSIKSKKIL